MDVSINILGYFWVVKHVLVYQFKIVKANGAVSIYYRFEAQVVLCVFVKFLPQDNAPQGVWIVAETCALSCLRITDISDAVRTMHESIVTHILA